MSCAVTIVQCESQAVEAVTLVAVQHNETTSILYIINRVEGLTELLMDEELKR